MGKRRKKGNLSNELDKMVIWTIAFKEHAEHTHIRFRKQCWNTSRRRPPPSKLPITKPVKYWASLLPSGERERGRTKNTWNSGPLKMSKWERSITSESPRRKASEASLICRNTLCYKGTFWNENDNNRKEKPKRRQFVENSTCTLSL